MSMVQELTDASSEYRLGSKEGNTFIQLILTNFEIHDIPASINNQ